MELMPRSATCAEFGISRCEFSEKILKITQPAKLHLVDIDTNAINIAHRKFPTKISSGVVEVNHGASADTVSQMPED